MRLPEGLAVGGVEGKAESCQNPQHCLLFRIDPGSYEEGSTIRDWRLTAGNGDIGYR
jgi:hypothetical protein